MKHYEKKLIKFRKYQNIASQSHKPSFVKCVVHNFSPYALSDAEITASSYGVDTHVPTNTNSNTIATLLRDISNISESEVSKIQTKLRKSKVKVLYTHRKIILELSKNEYIVILKQDKGGGVVVMNKRKHLEKCMSLLTTKHFREVDRDPTKVLKSKEQRSMRKLKSKLSSYEHKKLYPTGSCPGSLIELQSYINYLLMVKLMIYK